MDLLGFYIVRFINEDDAPGIISSNWLCNDGNECYYPNVKTNEMRDKLLRAKAEPDSSWDTHPIRIIKTYETYDLARRDLPRAEDTSDLDRDNELEKRKAKKRVLSLPGEDSDEENMQTVFKKIKKKPSFPKNKIIKPAINYSKSLPLSLHTSPPRPASQPSTSIIEPHHRIIKPTYYSQSPPLSLLASPPRPASQPLTPFFKSSAHLNAKNIFTTPQASRHNDAVLEQLAAINQWMEDMTKRVVEMSQKIDSMDSKMNEIFRKEHFNEEHQGLEFSDALPLRHLDDISHLENLLGDPSLRKKMVKFLSLCGGRDLQKTANNMMSRLLRDELAVSYSLTGKSTKGLAKHAFVGTRLWQIVLHSCQKVIKDATVDKVKECVANWLHQAKTRILRRSGPAEEEIIGEQE